jgi:hypothetical protein
MSRNATASWSGYSHQGKVALLIALRKINTLHANGGNLNDYILECENHEDASIKYHANILEAHQVKAKNGSTTIGAYTDALLLFTDGNQKFLHTTCEVTNWNTLTAAQNPNGVVRYSYQNGVLHCPLISITGYIDQEIAILLRNENHPQTENVPFRDIAMWDFLSRLDDRIRYEHAFKDQANYDISFSLEDVKQIILAPVAPAAARLVAIRQRLYQTFELFISDLDEGNIPITPQHEEAVTNALKKIYNLNDEKFQQFLRNINPHTSGGVRVETQILTDNFFVTDTFYSTFLGVLIKVTGAEYNLDDKCIPSYFRADSYLLTAISSQPERIKFFARKILDNQDVDFSAYEKDFLVTQHYSGTLSSHTSPIIRGDEDNRFMKMKDMKFINVQDAVLKLNEQP